MTTIGLDRRERITAALGAAALVALLVWGLVTALAISPRRIADTALDVFGIDLPPPPPPPRRPPPPHRPSYRASGAAAPPALRARATPVVAPPPAVVTPTPPPIVTAPVPNQGAAASQGAAPVPGPGTGAGGEGDGYGSGGDGRGDGAGDVPPRQVGGHLSFRDFPREAAARGEQGTVGVRFTVDVDGRVPGCQVTRSSGSPSLDETTCRLIMARFRYKPGHDARGRPFRATIVESHSWGMRRDAPGEDDEDDR